MVDSASIKLNLNGENHEKIFTGEDEIKWVNVSLSEVVERGKRLAASTFNIERNHALSILSKCKYDLVQLDSNAGGLKKCYYGDRAKRNYLTEVNDDSIGFLGSADMLDINPKPTNFIAPDNPMVKKLKLKENMILISRSGTIGNVVYVNKTLEKYIVSEHAIRLEMNDTPGYVYAYLKTDIAQSLLHAEKHGSVILEIEPESLRRILIPNAPYIVRKKIHDTIKESYNLRDKSNELINKAIKTIIRELDLPPLQELKKKSFSYNKEVKAFTVKLSELKGRLEGSYHNPIVNLIEEHLEKNAKLSSLGDSGIVKEIIQPGRFTRTYVEKDYGVPFIGGKDLFQLESNTGKYLSKKAHEDRLKKELYIRENSIILPSRGTIGRIMLATPQSYNNWAISDNLIQIVIDSKYIGYIYAFLNSEYGEVLINRQKYGGVVNAIEPIQLNEIKIPILNNTEKIEKINKLIENANNYRHKAFLLEKEAINEINESIIGI